VRRLVGIDINESYLARAAERFAAQIPNLPLVCADLNGTLPNIAPVDLIFAGLVFEYVDIAAAFRNLRSLAQPGGQLVAILQERAGATPAVTPTAFTTLNTLAPAFTFRDQDRFVASALIEGFPETNTRTIRLQSMKSFRVVTFNARHRATLANLNLTRIDTPLGGK
jgi:hypothetical protein